MTNGVVKLLLGPARSGKTTRLIEQYVRFLSEWQRDCREPRGIWIGPSQGAVRQVHDTLAARSKSALLDPRTVTFARFAEQLISQSNRRIRSINNWEKLRILQQLTRKLLGQKQLNYYQGVAHTPGFVRQVAQFIGELKRQDIWADEFRQRATRERDRDVSAIYTAYHHHLTSQNLYDAEGRFWAARDLLQEDNESRWGLIVVDGFTDFTAAQHDILRLLSQRSERLVISLLMQAEPMQPGSDRALMFGRTYATRERLEKTLPGIECELVGASHFSAPGIAHAERHLFDDDATQGSDPTGLSILAADSQQGEIQEVARRIKTLLLAGEAQPEEIAVVFPSLAEVAPRIKIISDDFGLPIALETTTLLAQTPLLRLLIRLLQLHTQDWPFDLLLDLAGVAAMQRIAGDKGENSEWRIAAERCIRRAQLPSGRTLLLEQLRWWAEKAEDPQEIVQDARVALPFFESLERLLSSLPERASLAAWIDSLSQLVESLGIADKHWDLLRRALSATLARDESLQVAGEELSCGDLEQLLEMQAAEITLRGEDAVGRVRILSAANARYLSVRHLFMAGLSEQSYSSSESVGRLYSQQELGRFAPDGLSEAPSAEALAGDAMLLFYEMVTRTSDCLTLSYAALDEKGQTLSPSPFLIELERCFSLRAIPKVTMAVGNRENGDRTPLSRSDWRLQGMEAALAGDCNWLAGLAPQNTGRAILRGVECVASRSQRDVFGPFEGLLASEAVRTALAHRFDEEHLWSPSRLETYAACPYRFFAEQILHLEPLEELALRSDHLRRGNLLHQVLAAIHQQPLDPDTPLSEEDLIDRFGKALEKIIAENPLGGLNEVLREIECREILAWAPQYAEPDIQYRHQWPLLDHPWRPAHFEVRFGPRKHASEEVYQDLLSQPVPFILDLGSEQIRLTGQIDRIDTGQVCGVTVFTIIDYKSGKGVKLKPTEMEAGRQLQLPLYALAAEKLLFADQQAVALATGYWNIKEKGFASGRDALLEFRTITADGLQDSTNWNSLKSSITRRIEEIVQGIRAGEFPVYNENKDCTASCDFSKMCRIAQIRSLEKVWPVP